MAKWHEETYVPGISSYVASRNVSVPSKLSLASPADDIAACS